MEQKYQFVGTYNREGSKLISTGGCLLISERKQITPNKPKYFLVDKTIPKGGYVSSLYPVNDCIYYFDYKGVKYQLELSDRVAEIKTKEQ
jgi:hypothetical protein